MKLFKKTNSRNVKQDNIVSGIIFLITVPYLCASTAMSMYLTIEAFSYLDNNANLHENILIKNEFGTFFNALAAASAGGGLLGGMMIAGGNMANPIRRGLKRAINYIAPR